MLSTVALPVWGTMKRVPNRKGRLRRQDIDAITQRGKAAVARVQKAIDKFAVRCVSDWPTTPQALIGNQALLDSLRRHARPGEQILRNFFDALIFERDHYTCRYCGRDAFAFFESNERTANNLACSGSSRRKNKKHKGVYQFNNSITSCWSCNTLKGPLPEEAFFSELDSLVDARLARRRAG